jgi:hypothetical protein
MLDGIQRDSAQHARSRVATTVRHPGVRRLVDADREQENDQLKQDVNMLQGHQALDLILTRDPGITRFLRLLLPRLPTRCFIIRAA